MLKFLVYFVIFNLIFQDIKRTKNMIFNAIIIIFVNGLVILIKVNELLLTIALIMYIYSSIFVISLEYLVILA